MTLRRMSKSKALSVVVALVLVGAVLSTLVYLNTRSEPQATAPPEGQAPLSHEPQVAPSQEPEVALPDEPQTTPSEEATPASSEDPQAASSTAVPKTVPTTETGVAPPDEPGPYNIGCYGVRYEAEPFGRYYATIRYPAEADGYRKPKDTTEGTYPGIVLGPSYCTLQWWTKWNAEHLASHGYVVLSFTPPNPLLWNPTQWAYGFNQGISTLKEQNSLSDSPIFGLVDTETFGITGLSMGGAGCIEAAGTNPEVDAAVPLAPGGIDMDLIDFVFQGYSNWTLTTAAENMTVPIQLQVGSNDGLLALFPNGVDSYYSLIPDTTPKQYVEINGANHVGFVDEFYANVAMWLLLDRSCAIGVEEQHRISRQYFTAWFHYFLKDLDEYGTYIFGDEAQQDVDAEVLSAFEHNLT